MFQGLALWLQEAYSFSVYFCSPVPCPIQLKWWFRVWQALLFHDGCCQLSWWGKGGWLVAFLLQLATGRILGRDTTTHNTKMLMKPPLSDYRWKSFCQTNCACSSWLCPTNWMFYSKIYLTRDLWTPTSRSDRVTVLVWGYPGRHRGEEEALGMVCYMADLIQRI